MRAHPSIIDVISLGLICLCSGYVHLYMCKKKNENEDEKKLKKKKKINTCVCMCIVFSIIEYVYWYLMVTLSRIFLGESSYVSFSRSFFLYIHFITSFAKEWDEWPSPRGSGSLSFLLLHSLLMWLHSMFNLSWSSFLFICSLFHSYPRHCFWFIPFTSPSYHSLTMTYSKFAILFASFLHISLSLRSPSFISSLILYSHWALLGPWLTNFSIHVAFHT